MKNQIIKYYKEVGGVNVTWKRFMIYGYTKVAIRDILFNAGVLKADPKTEAENFVPDQSHEFRYLHDADLNFENEIKSKLF